MRLVGVVTGCATLLLPPDGTPDDTFGVSSRGQPRLPLTFRTQPAGTG